MRWGGQRSAVFVDAFLLAVPHPIVVQRGARRGPNLPTLHFIEAATNVVILNTSPPMARNALEHGRGGVLGRGSQADEAVSEWVAILVNNEGGEREGNGGASGRVLRNLCRPDGRQGGRWRGARRG